MSGVDLLDKMIRLRHHSMDLCGKRANKVLGSIQKQNIKVLTNKAVKTKSMEDLDKHIKWENSITRPQDLLV